MSPETHSSMANFIWSICNLLRGPYKRNEYRKVILPLTVLKRFDAILGPTKAKVLAEHGKLKGKSENIVFPKLCSVTGTQFYNLSKLEFALPAEGLHSLLDDPNQLPANLVSYINKFSPNVRQIMERFEFEQQILKMSEKNILFQVVKAFCDPKLDLSPDKIDNMQMGYIFEELIRIGAEQSNEEAGEHFTPREVISLMVNLLLSDEPDLAKGHIVKTIYDPACGTGGMLSTADQYIRQLNADASPIAYGQDWNDEAFAICKADMLIKGQDAENIKRGDSFEDDGFQRDSNDDKYTFDYMLANPPFGVSWKQQQKFIEKEHEKLGYDGRFGAGLPRVNDGALLFLQHMISKMRPVDQGGSRIAIVFNGSPLFTGDAGSGESDIRQWIIENDWLEGIVALPDQLFYNTGISTYIWIVTNRKDKHRKGKVQLIDARRLWVPMRKSLGNKRHQIGDGKENRPDQIGHITKLYGSFEDGATHSQLVQNPHTDEFEDKSFVVSKIFDNDDFAYNKITVERPLRKNFAVTHERMPRLHSETAYANLSVSKKKDEQERNKAIAEGIGRQKDLWKLLEYLQEKTDGKVFLKRDEFIEVLDDAAKEQGMKLKAPERKAILSALGERDENADIFLDKDDNPEPDSQLRDTEIVPLKEDIQAYFEHEVLPHVPDAWIDHAKTKVGYEIPLTRHFYVYEPPRPLEKIETDLAELEKQIVGMLADVTGSKVEEIVS